MKEYEDIYDENSNYREEFLADDNEINGEQNIDNAQGEPYEPMPGIPDEEIDQFNFQTFDQSQPDYEARQQFKKFEEDLKKAEEEDIKRRHKIRDAKREKTLEEERKKTLEEDRKKKEEELKKKEKDNKIKTENRAEDNNEIKTDTDKQPVNNSNESLKKLPAKSFIINSLNLKYGLESLTGELKTIRDMLSKTQSNPNNNFFVEHGARNVKKEGSELYRDMTMKLRICIARMEDGESTPDDIRGALLDLQQSAAKYHKERDRFITGPWSPKGRKRRNAAKATAELVPVILTCYDRLTFKLASVTDSKGIPYSEKCFDDVNKKAQNLMGKYDMVDVWPKYISGTLKDGVKPVDRFNRELNLATKQNELVKKLGGLYPKLVKNYRFVNNQDELIVKSGINYNNPLELAKLYVAKKLLDMISEGSILQRDLKTAEDRINKRYIHEEAVKLLNDPAKANGFKAFPLKAFSMFDRFDEINKERIEVQAHFRDMVYSANEYHGSIGDGVVEKVYDKYKANNKRLCQITVISIMASPEGNNIVNRYCVSEYKDELYQAISIIVGESLNGKWALPKRNTKEEAVRDANNLIKNPEFRKYIVKRIENMKNPIWIVAGKQSEAMKEYEDKVTNDEKMLHEIMKLKVEVRQKQLEEQTKQYEENLKKGKNEQKKDEKKPQKVVKH